MNILNKLRRIRDNKVVRFLSRPIVLLQGEILLRRYQRSEDSQYIRTLKDSHKGEACFVIGNGPSLCPGDLDVLAENNMVCFGSNRIYKIFPQTAWRPTYYLCFDRYVAESEHENIFRIGNYPKFLDIKDAKRWGKPDSNIHYMCTENIFSVDPNSNVSKTLFDDLSKARSKPATVTVAAIELAIYMGFSTIYLLGVDHNYTHKRNPNGKIYVDPTVKASYFPGGEPNKALGVSVQSVELINESYKIAKKFAEEHDVEIYNATRGGKLEVFERMDFDELMGRKKEKSDE